MDGERLMQDVQFVPPVKGAGSGSQAVVSDALHYWAYAAAVYVLMNIGEDAAMVAFMFC